jgi:hypothetical protein
MQGRHLTVAVCGVGVAVWQTDASQMVFPKHRILVAVGVNQPVAGKCT